LVPGSTNRQVFDSVQSIVDKCVDGVNGTIFAYGQTSSGKTYTMFGNESEPGIITQSVSLVFNRILASPDSEYMLYVSYLEIYNEVIKDLLNPANDNLKIHENPNREIFVGKLSEEIVTSPQDIARLISIGEGNRHIGETNMNEKSSRSHTIFRMVPSTHLDY
jgi:centromeric protein E